MQATMENQESAPENAVHASAVSRLAGLRSILETNAPALGTGGAVAVGILATAGLCAVDAPVVLIGSIGALLCGLIGWHAQRRSEQQSSTLAAIVESVRQLDATPVEAEGGGDRQLLVETWNESWPERCQLIQDAQNMLTELRAMPARLTVTCDSITEASDNQEEAVEETASLVANMKQSMSAIGERVAQLLESADASASSILEISSSIDEVAANTATLHEVVEASTSSVHEMSASIRQVAQSAEHVQEMAETTAASVIEMDRSVQEVSSHALEAAALTEKANAGATAGSEAVRATIEDIERISSLTSEAKDRLSGLVSRISQIGNILSAIDEINDETKLLSLNAAIIAAQAGEQGKAFLVVANHVKTLAQRTAGSTQDIEKLIADIEKESAGAVRAMEAGIDAVATGVERSRGAGQALSSIQDACRDASERVGEIAHATAEQSRNSKGVAEATQATSTEIQQISLAIGEQRRASEAMLESAESALSSCRHVHRSTDEQRHTSKHITAAITEITEMIRAIGDQTKVHAKASDSVGEAVMRLLDNAQQSGANIDPIRGAIADLGRITTRQSR
jgi:methyl-accepting chemotaxis protein